MEFFDSHCHLQFRNFYERDFDGDYSKSEELRGIIDRALSNGVSAMLSIGCNLLDSKNAIQIANAFEEVYAAVGVHPVDLRKEPENYLKELHTLANKNPKVKAIGETGIDYFHKDTAREMQWDGFRAQIRLAKELKLPLIIHTRDAEEDTLKIMKEEDVGPCVMHCFASSWEFAQECLDLGSMISFTGILTYPKATNVQEVAAKTPLERIMIETDSPYLAPQAYRGKKNEPSYVVEVAKKLAELKDIPLEQVARETTKNAREFLKIS